MKRSTHDLRLKILAIIAAFVALAAVAFLLFTPGVGSWSGSSIVRLHIIVADAEVHETLSGARVQLSYPEDPSRPTMAAITEGGVVELLCEFNTFGHTDGWRSSAVVSYSGWIIEADMPGYRPFVAPLGDTVGQARDGRPVDPPLSLEQPTNGRAECVVDLKKIASEAENAEVCR